MLLLPATVTMDEARDAAAMLAQAIKREPDATVVIDASGLQQFDTAVIALLLECRRLAQAWGKHCALRHVPPQLAALTRLYGVDSLLPPDGAGATPARTPAAQPAA